jgi:hypothetical protein
LSTNYFSKLDNFITVAESGDALVEWLNTPPMASVADPIGWWTAMEKTGHPLALMLLDFLSTPGKKSYNA